MMHAPLFSRGKEMSSKLANTPQDTEWHVKTRLIWMLTREGQNTSTNKIYIVVSEITTAYHINQTWGGETTAHTISAHDCGIRTHPDHPDKLPRVHPISTWVHTRGKRRRYTFHTEAASWPWPSNLGSHPSSVPTQYNGEKVTRCFCAAQRDAETAKHIWVPSREKKRKNRNNWIKRIKINEIKIKSKKKRGKK